MTSIALDFSSARPSGDEIVAAGALHVLAYTGSGKPRPTRAEIDGWLAAGCSFTFIQESYATRAQQGYQAGIADARYADTQADGVGYPDDAAIAYCASDGTRTNPGADAVPAISEYGRGVADASHRPLLAYGNRVAVDAFRSGAGAKCVGTWVPATWGAIPGTDVLIQEPNIASPIPDTDWNTVHGEWPCWTGDTMPLTEADFDRINLIVLGHILDLAGGANLDGSLVSTRLLETKIDALPPGQGGGVTMEQVRAIVRDELDATKLSH